VTGDAYGEIRSRAETAAVRDALGQAAGGVLAALIALADPQAVVVGGPWGQHPAILAAVAAAAARLPRPVTVRAARVISEPSLSGAGRRPSACCGRPS
jgi:predicted NBD/HSP70 family sugar kinase